LGNTYWKSMWPKPDDKDASTPSQFDPARFWLHGGPLFFGDTISKEVAAGFDPTSVLSCQCDVEMATADNVEVRQTILYHLNMDHAVAEIKAMDREQFPLDFQQRWNKGRLSAILDMTDMWGPTRDGGVKARFFEDKKAWRAWLHAAREVVMDWDGFDTWDWDGFSNVRTIGINKLSQEDFYRISLRLLIFFIRSFITRLGYYPSPMLYPPVLASPRCESHRHKFATGLL
jgi:hypothetical protein